MRAGPRLSGWLVIAVLLAFAVPIAILASPGAATISILVILVGLLLGLLIQGQLNRQRVGRWRISLRPSRPYLVPADLPPPPGLLIGRDDDLARICRLLGDAWRQDRPAVVVVTGGEGVGKTALAVTAGHILTSDYPDGQILVRFDTQRPDGDEHAREYLTKALIAPTETVPAPAEFDRWYRRNTARRRVLVVLDNVADNMDVARFRPAGHKCAMIVTSRTPVESPTPDLAVSLLPLDDTAAAQLLTKLLGEHVEDVDPAYVTTIVSAAHGFPAALQMAGAVMRARRSWDLDVAFRGARQIVLSPPADAADAPAFVDVLNLACALLTEQERSCLALLALLDTRHVAHWMLVALANGAFPDWTTFDEIEAGRIMDRLARVRFAELRVDDRSGVVEYRVPSYVKAYAAMLLRAEVSPDAIAQAKTSFTEGWRQRLERRPELQARRNVYRLLDGGQLDEALGAAREALHLAQDRRRNAGELRGVEADAIRGDQALAEVALAEVFAELGWIDDALTYAVSAERGVEPLTTIRALRVQGRIRWRLRQSTAALEKLDAAHEMAEKLADRDPAEHVRVLRELSVATALSPNPEPALTFGVEAEALCSAPDGTESRRLPSVLWAHGLALTANGRYAEAGDALIRADRLSSRADLDQGLWRPWIRHQRAYVALQLGQYDTARGLAASALEGFTAIIHRYGSGHCRLVAGRAWLAERNYDRAVPTLEEALQTFERCGDRWVEADTSYWLGLAYAGLSTGADETADRTEDAIGILSAAYDTFVTLKDQRSASRTQAALRELDPRDGTRLSRLTRRDRHPESARVLA